MFSGWGFFQELALIFFFATASPEVQLCLDHRLLMTVVQKTFCRAFWACDNLLKSLTFLASLHWGGVQGGLALVGSDPEASTPSTSKHCSICSVSSSKRNAFCVLWGSSIMWTTAQISGHHQKMCFRNIRSRPELNTLQSISKAYKVD